MRHAIAALLLLAAACADSPPDFFVHGAGVSVRTAALYARQPDLPGRIEHVLAVGLQYWGGDWSDLSGARITLLDGPYVPCAATANAIGCYDGENLTISSSDPGAGTFSCVEQTVLVHEVGHAVIGDPSHTDPRWMDFEAVGAALAGGTGYTADGAVACDVELSVWRHPPGP